MILPMKKFILLLCLISDLSAKDTFTPISDPDKLPKSALELWQGYDARAEDLEVKIIEEWKTDDVTTRYLTYKVGRFKGIDSRVSAYYSFPNKPGNIPRSYGLTVAGSGLSATEAFILPSRDLPISISIGLDGP